MLFKLMLATNCWCFVRGGLGAYYVTRLHGIILLTPIDTHWGKYI